MKKIETSGFELDEQSVIGSVILNGRKENVSADDFVFEKHKIIWGVIEYLSDREMPVDLVTICTRLQEISKLEIIGGPEYIAEIQNIVPTGTHSAKYAEIVKTRATRRKIKEISTKEFDEDQTNEAIIGEITRELQSLAKPAENKSLIQLIKEYEKQKKEKKTGMMTGFDWLDSKTNGISEGMFWMITAKSFVGKTTFTLQMIRNICDQVGKKATVYTLEQSAVNVLKNLERVQRHKKADIDQLAMMQLEIVDSLRTWDEIAIDAQKRESDVIVVDYAQMVGIEGKGIYEKMENLAYAIRGFCNKTKIAVILISQISEEARKSSGAHDGAKGGGALFHACDVFLNLRGDEQKERDQRSHDEYYLKDESFGDTKKEFTREIILAKHKYGDIGYRQTQFNYSLGYGVYIEF